jgi:hypothetical protein
VKNKISIIMSSIIMSSKYYSRAEPQGCILITRIKGQSNPEGVTLLKHELKDKPTPKG